LLCVFKTLDPVLAGTHGVGAVFCSTRQLKIAINGEPVGGSPFPVYFSEKPAGSGTPNASNPLSPGVNANGQAPPPTDPTMAAAAAAAAAIASSSAAPAVSLPFAGANPGLAAFMMQGAGNMGTPIPISTGLGMPSLPGMNVSSTFSCLLLMIFMSCHFYFISPASQTQVIETKNM
jgi:hypothetical protein